MLYILVGYFFLTNVSISPKITLILIKNIFLFQTLALLNQFKSKLTQAIAETPEDNVSEMEVEDDEGW